MRLMLRLRGSRRHARFETPASSHSIASGAASHARLSGPTREANALAFLWLSGVFAAIRRHRSRSEPIGAEHADRAVHVIRPVAPGTGTVGGNRGNFAPDRETVAAANG